MSTRLPVFFLVFFLSLGTALAEDREISEYRIAPNDLLEIKVYEEPDLTKDVRVSQDGQVSYPLLGNIKVVGLSARQLEDKIAGLLGEDYLVNPQVSVTVKEYVRVSILGEVRSPGSYEIKGILPLTRVLAMAGGLNERANSCDIKIIRVNGNMKETIEVNLDRILQKAAQDIEIKGNDTIVVGQIGKIYVLGKVQRPGAYELKKGLTTVEAIALAGGFTDTAAPNGTKLIRIEDGKKTVIAIPVGSLLSGGGRLSDIPLQENDTIVVPESFF